MHYEDLYDPDLSLAKNGRRMGVTREWVRQLFPHHASARRSIRMLDEALALVRGEKHSLTTRSSVDGRRFVVGAAEYCTDCQRRIRGPGAEVVPRNNDMALCWRCSNRRNPQTAAATMLRYRHRRGGPPKVPATRPCAGLNALGEPCACRALRGSRYCRWGEKPWHRPENRP